MSPESTAYLTDKCEVQNRDVTGGKAVFAREVIEPGELIAVWSGRIVGRRGAGRAPRGHQAPHRAGRGGTLSRLAHGGRAAGLHQSFVRAECRGWTDRSPLSPCIVSCPAKK